MVEAPRFQDDQHMNVLSTIYMVRQESNDTECVAQQLATL